jgi:hypothetical protein
VNEPSPFGERFRGHRHPARDLMFTRPASSRKVYVGIAGSGYVRLTVEEARRAGFALLELAGADFED